jgi:hypothetical protein
VSSFPKGAFFCSVCFSFQKANFRTHLFYSLTSTRKVKKKSKANIA